MIGDGPRAHESGACVGGRVYGGVNESPIVGITFAYDGANMVSGAAQGWTEFSATRR